MGATEQETFYKGKRVPVTGGAGFPGSFSCERLLAEGARAAVTGSSSSIGFQQQRRPDISLARSKLEWEPQIALNRGLEKTIAYFEWQLRN
jgi:UDP-glucuronate decarboxylase